MKRTLSTSLLKILSTGAMVATAGIVGLVAQQAPQELFADVSPESHLNLDQVFTKDVQKDSLIRTRFVEWRPDALGLAGSELILNAFNDRKIVVEIDRVEVVAHALVYVGTVKGEPMSAVYVGQVEDSYYAQYTSPGENSLRIRSVERFGQKGLYRIDEIDSSRVQFECMNNDPEFHSVVNERVQSLETAISSTESQAPPLAMMSGGGQTHYLDLVVLYTTNTSYFFGSNAAAEAAIASGVSEMNGILHNTQISAADTYQIRLKGILHVNYSEQPISGSSVWAKLHCQCDGLAGTEAYADSLGADHIQLWYHDYQQTQPQGGADWLTSSNGTTPDVKSKFSVIDVAIALGSSGRYAAMHEIGHSLGLNHKWQDENNNDPSNPMNELRWDLGAMGFDSAEDHPLIFPWPITFADVGYGLANYTVPQFTNPATTVQFQGQTYLMGRWGTTPPQRPANAAATLQTTFPVVGGFSSCTTCPPKVTLPSPCSANCP